jgi:hypothetical protein
MARRIMSSDKPKAVPVRESIPGLASQRYG